MTSEKQKKNILVIGGGPAGLEAAKCLGELGYTVFLVEREDHLGGHLAKWDRLFPKGESAPELLKKMTAALGDVKTFLNTEVSQINKLEKIYNVVLTNGISVAADAILITSGFKVFPAEKKEEYGYGIYDRVITSVDLENCFLEQKINTLGNPKRIGFVHCVGSRDEKAGNRYCSKVCCATAVKQASEIKQMFPDAMVYCFYMDLRMFGMGFEDMYLDAQKKYGVVFVRGRVSEVSENKDGSLFVKAEDTLAGKPLRVSLDLLVLMVGMMPHPAIAPVTKMLDLSTINDGFIAGKDLISEGQTSYHKGIFIAGACNGPKTLPETIAEARSAVFNIDLFLSKND